MQPAENQNWERLREELLAAVRKGEEAPLRRFHDGHFGEVYRYVLCRLDGNHADAEEVAADVFYQAFRDMAGYDGKTPPAVWLRGIARHRLIDFFRRRGKRPVVELVFSRFDEEFTRKLFDLEAAELPADELERAELARVVELVLSELPGDYEKVLRMHYLEERPVKEMAEVLATTPKAAEARLWRARTAFCEGFRLAGRNLDFGGAEAGK
ncbi:MAG TPA: RNA polymerase sigma factor [Planctomycetota bacterium]|nr:RNA polymerase sigma factor [Planctomycetota bacterium]